MSGLLVWIKWSICISISQQIVCVSLTGMVSHLCQKRIPFPTQSFLVFLVYCICLQCDWSFYLFLHITYSYYSFALNCFSYYDKWSLWRLFVLLLNSVSLFRYNCCCHVHFFSMAIRQILTWNLYSGVFSSHSYFLVLPFVLSVLMLPLR